MKNSKPDYISPLDTLLPSQEIQEGQENTILDMNI